MTHRILFISEDITLAQIVRLKCLADSLKGLPLEVHFASSQFDSSLLGQPDFKLWKLKVIDKQQADKAVEQCKRIYEQPTLEQYIQDDLQLIDAVKPDLIVGDLRLSLPISARVAKVPFAVLINAYWSPAVVRDDFPMPDHPLEKVFGYERMKPMFPYIRPIVFQHFAKPFNVLRKKYGLRPIGSLQSLLTYGDHVLFPDTPSLVPLQSQSANEHFLGPILWSPPVGIPPEIVDVMEQDFVYVTLGSSGRTERVEVLMQGLAQLGLPAVVTSAGRYETQTPPNVHLCAYLPGNRLARKARLVISNGGSTTGYQALSQGTPVLGLASNLDQYLCMQSMEALGVGKHLRGGSYTAQDLASTADELIKNPSYRQRAEAAKADIAKHDYAQAFGHFLQQAI